MNELTYTEPAPLALTGETAATTADTARPSAGAAGAMATAPVVSVGFQPVPFGRAPLVRRLIADVIDGLVPLPFLVAVVPPWIVVCLAYACFCDGRGASVGKRLMGLSVVCVGASSSRWGRPCNPGRSLLRNGGICLCALGAVSAWLAPLALSFLAIESLTVVFHKQGRRLGDLLAGTQVVSGDAKEAAR